MLGAELIYDNIWSHISPVTDASHNQDRGTIAARLSERAGRICYDSYGKGRSSELYHEHILSVNHTSIYEHFNWVVETSKPLDEVLRSLANRPGFWVEATDYGSVRVVLNRRCVLDWEQFGPKDDLYYELLTSADWHYPEELTRRESGVIFGPISEEERWLSFQICCSRGCSHELVRHKFRTAVSQRSTRYVDESKSAWIVHPALMSYSQKHFFDEVKDVARGTYEDIVDELTPVVGRKQARGAARGFLGNALSTELIFSASVAQWRRMIAQRDNEAADAEIRDLFRGYITPIVEVI